ncbi:uncharacterized protein [Spinacia oleracea]|uniref:Endoplasmic reticulum transmembrane protein n=1 Tax=Spinacia oleracea TaxID=3562 RepID=A0ABM3QKQ5_SPIOL|nr:uncharacterized protein LOC110800569 [Spinacia oleracea]
MILTYAVAAEAAIFLVISLPLPKVLRTRLVSLISLILQPLMFIVPFAAFQLLDIYWKYEHQLTCTSEICTVTERDRYEKSEKMDHHTAVCYAILTLAMATSSAIQIGARDEFRKTQIIATNSPFSIAPETLQKQIDCFHVDNQAVSSSAPD